MTKRSVTCLYTELAKSYFLLGPVMAEENTCEECSNISSVCICDEEDFE